MDFEIHVGHPFKQIDQIFEGVYVISLACFNPAVDYSAGRGSISLSEPSFYGKIRP
jgi:hypothetical protein